MTNQEIAVEFTKALIPQIVSELHPLAVEIEGIDMIVSCYRSLLTTLDESFENGLRKERVKGSD